MRIKFSGTPLARYQIFTLADGSYVVQWDDKQVQELLTGRYRTFDNRRDFGHAITDYELKQLKAAGRVEHFNRDYVWLFALPEHGRYPTRREMGRGDRYRAYYLSTPLPQARLGDLQALLDAAQMEPPVQLMVRHQTVVIMAADGAHFADLDQAEQAQAGLLALLPPAFTELTIAYDEINQRSFVDTVDRRAVPPTVEELIASQTDTTLTEGRTVILWLNQPEERAAFNELLSKMKLQVLVADSVVQTLTLLEDHPVDLLLIDLQLPEIHGWQLVNRVRELETARDLPVLMITDAVNISMTVAKVDYLTRPVSIARLRHSVWKTLSERVKKTLR